MRIGLLRKSTKLRRESQRLICTAAALEAEAATANHDKVQDGELEGYVAQFTENRDCVEEERVRLPKSRFGGLKNEDAGRVERRRWRRRRRVADTDADDISRWGVCVIKVHQDFL